MADATLTFATKGAESVTKATDQMAKGMNNIKRSSSRGGYAILEASRAMEDFSMAGMRGALNNIPPLLMGMGVGAGLTGVIGGLTVAVWKGGEMWEKYTDKLWHARVAAAGAGAASVNIEDMLGSFDASASKQVQEMADALAEMAVQADYLNNLSNISDSTSKTERELALQKELLFIIKMNGTEEQKRNSIKNAGLREIEAEAKANEDAVRERKAKIEELQGVIEEQQDLVSKNPEPEIIAANKASQEEYNKVYKRLMSERESWIEENIGTSHRLGIALAGAIGLMADNPEQMYEEKAAEAATKASKKLLDELLPPSNRAMKIAAQEAAAAEENVKRLEKELAAENALLAKEEDNAKEGAKRLQLEKEILQAKEDQVLAEEKRKQEEEKAKAMHDAMMKERAVDVSGFLSSQGRAGLAGNEAKVAMDTLGIQRNMLRELKTISRNTRNNSTRYN